MPRLAPLAVLATALLATPAAAQVHTPGMVHTAGMTHTEPAVPTEAGQSAFAAIAEIVAILDADPTTDWSTVNIEALRQHLRDMDEVVLRSVVAPTRLDGGVSLAVTGAGRTVEAIGRMLPAHAKELETMPRYRARTEPLTNGIRLIVIAEDPDDVATIRRIQALGLAGLLAEGAHHQPHHLQMARGDHGHH